VGLACYIDSCRGLSDLVRASMGCWLTVARELAQGLVAVYGVCGLMLLVYEAVSYWCMQASVAGYCCMRLIDRIRRQDKLQMTAYDDKTLSYCCMRLTD
jgi:hypothetical protein